MLETTQTVELTEQTTNVETIFTVYKNLYYQSVIEIINFLTIKVLEIIFLQCYITSQNLRTHSRLAPYNKSLI